MNENDSTNWGIVELMGHKVVAGLIQKTELLGAALLRVDVPATSAYPAFTQVYGTAAIYCVTFTSEEVARLAAERAEVNPVSIYVPELITVAKHEEQVDQLKERIRELSTRLQTQALGAGNEFSYIDEKMSERNLDEEDDLDESPEDRILEDDDRDTPF